MRHLRLDREQLPRGGRRLEAVRQVLRAGRCDCGEASRARASTGSRVRWSDAGRCARARRRVGGASALGPLRRSARRSTPVRWDDLRHSYRAGCPVGPAAAPDAPRLPLGLRRPRPRRARSSSRAGSRRTSSRCSGVLWEARFPIRRLQPVSAYRGSDDASMAADNTSGFNCRFVGGTSRWSMHAYGEAIDVNPVENPYVQGSTVSPPAGRAYLDRSRYRKGMAVRGRRPRARLRVGRLEVGRRASATTSTSRRRAARTRHLRNERTGTVPAAARRKDVRISRAASRTAPRRRTARSRRGGSRSRGSPWRRAARPRR